MKNLHIALGCLSMAALVAGCSGGSGGGSNGPSYAALSAQHEALVAEEDALSATATMPIVGTATYAGTAEFTSTDPEGGSVLGALTLNADFENLVIDGDISNFRTDDGAAVNGSLAVEDGEIIGNAIMADLSGELSQSGETGVFTGTMTGGFSGDDAEMVAGTATLDGDFGGGDTESFTGEFVAKR